MPADGGSRNVYRHDDRLGAFRATGRGLRSLSVAGGQRRAPEGARWRRVATDGLHSTPTEPLRSDRGVIRLSPPMHNSTFDAGSRDGAVLRMYFTRYAARPLAGGPFVVFAGSARTGRSPPNPPHPSGARRSAIHPQARPGSNAWRGSQSIPSNSLVTNIGSTGSIRPASMERWSGQPAASMRRPAAAPSYAVRRNSAVPSDIQAHLAAGSPS